LKHCPEITKFQAITLRELEPLSKLVDWEWRQTMVNGCGMIDQFLKDLERPIISPTVAGKPFPRIAKRVPLLARASRRDIEVLVYSPDKKWWPL
jgi:hypothetical protein